MKIFQQLVNRNHGDWYVRRYLPIYKPFVAFLLGTMLISPTRAQAKQQTRDTETEITCKIIVMPEQFINIQPTEAELKYFGRKLVEQHVIANAGKEFKAGINGNRFNLDLVRTLEGPLYSRFSLNFQEESEVGSIELGFHNVVTLYAGQPSITLTGIDEKGESTYILLRSQPVKK